MWGLQREVILIKFLDGDTPTLRAFSPSYLCWELITPVVLFTVGVFLVVVDFFFFFKRNAPMSSVKS